MNLNKIRIVLSHPEESRNIGAVCRAMGNNDIKILRIVGKREDYDDSHIRVLAIHASPIWDSAQFFNSITEATADCTVSAGTTRRRGKKRKEKLLFPEEFSSLAAKISAGSESGAGNIAVVFGNERTGLTDSELQECTIGVTIPSSQGFPSLNLSHAVQIMCYQLFREKNKGKHGYTPLTLNEIDKTVKSLTDDLKKIGFFRIAGRSDMESFWRNLLSRAAVSESEIQYIEKIFGKIAGLVSKNKPATSPQICSEASSSNEELNSPHE